MATTGTITREIFMRDYWRYYLMLEKKFVATENYVTLTQQNYGTFSNEYASLLQLIGAELDGFFKRYCGFELDDKKNISDYASAILSTDPAIKQQEIQIEYSDLVIRPFDGWDMNKAKQSLTWWEAFDSIKHNRIEKKEVASLRNVLNILGALFLLEIKYLKKISKEYNVPDVPDEPSSLFDLKNWQFEYMSGGDAFLKFAKDVENMLQ